jgi:hypothetical protein
MELKLDPIRTYNPVNGRFNKGHEPFNKGLKWDDYMDMRKAKRIKKNLLLGKGRKDIGGWNKKKVIGIIDGKWFVFASAAKAAEKTGLNRRNISHCCAGDRKKCGGIMWFFESSNEWIKLINDENRI